VSTLKFDVHDDFTDQLTGETGSNYLTDQGDARASQRGHLPLAHSSMHRVDGTNGVCQLPRLCLIAAASVRYLCLCLHQVLFACVSTCVRVCVRACVRVGVRACVRGECAWCANERNEI